MEKNFEDYFSELQTDMVSICLEYIENKAENIYIYGSYEPNAYYFNVFFRIEGKYVLKHQVNDNFSTPIYNTATDRQIGVQRIGINDLEEIHKKCEEFNREMPTEIKLYYNVKSNSLKGQYKYDLVYSNDNELLPSDIFESWFEEVKKSSL